MANLQQFKRQDSDDGDIPIPDHACEQNFLQIIFSLINFKSYCQASEYGSVAQCECRRWFCNTYIKGGSHIITHLVKAKHNQLTIHPQNPMGSISIECYACEQRNIFQLGNVPIHVDEEESILILCRTCASIGKFQELVWDQSQFNSLIIDKCIQTWLLSQNAIRKGREIQLDKIIQYEEEKKIKPTIKIEDVLSKENVKQLKQVQLKFYSGSHYVQVFSPLIKLEEEQDKQVKEGQSQLGVKVRWDLSLKKKRQAYFTYGLKEEFDTNQLLGTEMSISYKGPNHPPWQSKGTVVKIINEEVCLELHNNDPPPPTDTGYHLEYIWASTTFKRMLSGLKRFANHQESISSFLYRAILGEDAQYTGKSIVEFIPQILSAPNLPELNAYQADACKKALKQPLALIQGPPGTGKTVTSATLVYQLVKSIEKTKQQQRSQILVCAPSNIVVDQLAEKINQTGLKVVRLCSKTRESVSSNVEMLTLHSQVRSLELPQYRQLQNLYQLLDETGELAGKDEAIFMRMRDEAEKEILQNADVICTTCIGSADKRLQGSKFLHVLIDEATQAIEPECLLPMLKGAKHVILVGDHRQLGPVVQSRHTAQAGLDRSMFERLVQLGNRPVRLQVQYRMHPELTVFPSNTFYEGTLQNGVTVSDRTHLGGFAWPNKQKPMFFLNVPGQEQYSASGTSYLNTQEAVQVEKAVQYLVQAGVKPNQIGIITPYKGQRTYIMNYLVKNGQLAFQSYKEIEVASVDGFQGREKDFIIISCVRSNEGAGIGFLTNPRRLNVTITRARYGLIIVGNANVLSQDKLWNNMLNHFKDQDLLMDGSIPVLKPSHMKLKPIQKYIAERRNNTMKDDDNDSQSVYSYQTQDNLNQFEFDQGDLPLTAGFRQSQFGYNQIPESKPFEKIQEQIKTRQIDVDNSQIVQVKGYDGVGKFVNDVELDF